MPKGKRQNTKHGFDPFEKMNTVSKKNTKKAVSKIAVKRTDFFVELPSDVFILILLQIFSVSDHCAKVLTLKMYGRMRSVCKDWLVLINSEKVQMHLFPIFRACWYKVSPINDIVRFYDMTEKSKDSSDRAKMYDNPNPLRFSTDYFYRDSYSSAKMCTYSELVTSGYDTCLNFGRLFSMLITKLKPIFRKIVSRYPEFDMSKIAFCYPNSCWANGSLDGTVRLLIPNRMVPFDNHLPYSPTAIPDEILEATTWTHHNGHCTMTVEVRNNDIVFHFWNTLYDCVKISIQKNR